MGQLSDRAKHVGCVQIRVYFPQLGHPGYGVVRSLVRDSLDESSTPEAQTFLDSDGLIGQVLRNETSAALEKGQAMLQVPAFEFPLSPESPFPMRWFLSRLTGMSSCRLLHIEDADDFQPLHSDHRFTFKCSSHYFKLTSGAKTIRPWHLNQVYFSAGLV